MERQERLKFDGSRGRQLWLIANARIPPAQITEGRRTLTVSPNLQRLALRALLDFQRDNAYAWPSQRILCDWLGDWSLSKLNRVLKALKAGHLVAIENGWNSATGTKTARYSICFANLSDLAEESLETGPDHFPTAPDHFPTAPDHFPTMGKGIRSIESNKDKQTAGRSDARRAADLARQLAGQLRPRGNRQHVELRAICQRVTAGDIPQKAVCDALAAVADRQPARPYGYFKAVLTNNWGVFL